MANLKQKGYWIIEDVYSKDYCNSLIDFINNYKEENNIEINYKGTELRIWDAQKKNNLFLRFYQESNHLLSRLLGSRQEAKTLLAIKNLPLNSDDDDSKKGRWHLDSFRNQLKTFLFLTDTNENSGVFEFIPESHKMIFKLNMLFRGHYFRLSDFFKGKKKRSYQWLNDSLIEKLLSTDMPSMPVLCKAGTVLIVDTSAIHRARPCSEGHRYALTAYY